MLFITPLTFIFIANYYFSKKKTYFFRKQIPNIFFIIAINYILYFYIVFLTV